MKRFITVFKFTFFQNFKTKSFIILTLLGILCIGIFTNINNIKNSFLSKTNANKKIVAFYDVDSSFNLTEDRLSKSLADKYVYKQVGNKYEADKIKEDISKGDSKYFALVIIESKNTEQAKIYVDHVTDSQDMNQFKNYIQNIFINEKAHKMNLDENSYKYLLANIPIEIVQKDKNHTNNMILVYFMMFILYFIIMLYGVMVGNSIVEEKSNRIMETLITIAKPTELFFGKVFAVCALGLSQMCIFIASAYSFLKLNKIDIYSIGGFNIVIPPNILIFFVIFILLGYLFYSFIYGAMGSLVSNSQESSQAMLPMTLVLMVVSYLGIIGIQNPNNNLIKILSYIPFSSPILMFERIGLSSVNWYEIFFSIIILILSILIVGVLSSKIYKKGVLHYGKRLSVLKVIRGLSKK